MMRSNSKTCSPSQKDALKGIMFLLCLLIPDYATAECLCNLNYTTRQARDREIENNAKQYIHVFTANRTDTIRLKSSFNLTFEITNYAAKQNQSLVDFVLAGGLYDMSWAVFPLGSNIIFIDFRVLPDYVRNVYPSIVRDNLRDRSKTFYYPLGAYRPPMTTLNYNYASLDFGSDAPSLCYCNASTGFSFAIQFRVNAPFELKWDLYYSWTLNSTLYMTDLELAVDDYASKAFGEAFIHSNFGNITTTNITMKLYFKGQYDIFWSSDTSEVNNKLHNMTNLHLKFLKTNLTLTNPPRAIGCYLWVDYSDKECTKPTTSIITTSMRNDTFTTTVTETSSNPSTSNGSYTTLANTVNAGPSNPHSNNSSYLTTNNSNIMGNTTPITITRQSNVSSTTNVPAYNDTSTLTSTYTQLSTNYVTGTSLVSNQNLVNSTETVSSATGNTSNTITTDFPLVTTSNATISTKASSTTPSTDVSLNSLPQTPVNAFQSPLNSTLAASTTKLPTRATFDKDPLFLAQVPVISKVYNDRILLQRVQGTVEYVSDQGYFYTIAIPAALGILIISGLCLIICQIDWIAFLAPKNSEVRT